MTTYELINKLHELGYTYKKSAYYISIINKEQPQVVFASIDRKHKNKMNLIFDTDVVPDKLFDILAEYVKTPPLYRNDNDLTKNETTYLKFLQLEEFNWLARDVHGALLAFYFKPTKDEESGTWIKNLGDDFDLGVSFKPTQMSERAQNMFNIIQWSSNEPYEIDKLLQYF